MPASLRVPSALLLLLTFAASACATLAGPRDVARPSANFDFEDGATDAGLPRGWAATGELDSFRFAVDRTIRRSGSAGARIRRVIGPGGAFATMMSCVDPAGLEGVTVRLAGWLRTEGVRGRAILWLRLEDGDRPFVRSSQPIDGTTEWTEVQTPSGVLPAGGTRLCAGFMLDGDGTAWADDLVIRTG